jgi:hypothetical protein
MGKDIHTKSISNLSRLNLDRYTAMLYKRWFLYLIPNTKYLILAVFTFLSFWNTASAGVILQAPTYVGLGNGLVGYWSFDGQDVAGVTAYDRSGQGYNGTLTGGPARVAGKIGQALSFDGTDDYVQLPSGAAQIGSGDISVSAWIFKQANHPFGNRAAISSRVSGAGGTEIGYSLITSSSFHQISFSVDDGAGVSSQAGSNIAVGWHHVVGVFVNGQANRIYMDGALATEDTTDIPAGDLTGEFPARIGMASQGSNVYASLIDDVRIYNRALSADEIKRLYKIGGTLKFNVTRKDTVADGLVGYWSFDGQDMAGVTAYDRSGQGNNGTLTNGPTRVAGKLGQALEFDGSDDSVVVSDFGVDGELTMSASLWVKSQLSSSPGTTFAAETGVFRFRWEANKNMRFAVWTDQGQVLCGTSFNYTDASWHHIVGTYDGAEVGVYVDGIKRGACPQSGAIATSTNVGLIGGDFLGTIDDVRTYNRVLSADEIKRLYNMGGTFYINSSQKHVLTDGLVGYWSFDAKDMAGVTAYDRSGQGNNGTLTNGPARAAGKLGQALEFDGNDDYVQLPSGAAQIGSGDITVSAWIFNKGISDGQNKTVLASRVSGSSGTQTGYDLVMGSLSTSISWRIDDGVGGFSNPTSALAAGWHHLVGVFVNGQATRLYVDGALAAEDTSDIPAGDLTSPVSAVIGAHNGGASPYNSAIDEARIYNRALSPDEIKRLYNLGR